jgi:histidyl-tRNA synthetase
MVDVKGLDAAVADRLGEYVKIRGEPRAVLSRLQSIAEFAAHAECARGLRDLATLFDYLDAMGCLAHIHFDLSLARGLDYYTGVIFEALQTGPTKVGSIAAGGRYDGLVGMFSGKQVRSVGMSVGIERILAILEEAEAARAGARGIKRSGTQVLVGCIGADLLVARMRMASQLWQVGVAAEFLYDLNPKPKKQLDYALANHIPVVVWIGEDELRRGVVKIKNLNTKVEEEVDINNATPAVQKAVADAERTAAVAGATAAAAPPVTQAAAAAQ